MRKVLKPPYTYPVPSSDTVVFRFSSLVLACKRNRMYLAAPAKQHLQPSLTEFASRSLNSCGLIRRALATNAWPTPTRGKTNQLRRRHSVMCRSPAAFLAAALASCGRISPSKSQAARSSGVLLRSTVPHFTEHFACKWQVAKSWFWRGPNQPTWPTVPSGFKRGHLTYQRGIV